MGKSDNMMMLEHVNDVVKSLIINKDDKLCFVAIDKNYQPQVADNLDDVSWTAAKEAYIFLFKGTSECLIRHIDEDYRVHKQILLHEGFIICSDWNTNTLSLYRGKKLIVEILMNTLMIENFSQAFDSLWNEYIYEGQCIQCES